MTISQAIQRLQSIVSPTASFCVTSEVWRHADFGAGRIEVGYRVAVFTDENNNVRIQRVGLDLGELIVLVEADLSPAPTPIAQVDALSEQMEALEV